MKNLFSEFFDSFSVKGDKITIHKCVIDTAIKRVKQNPDPFENADRTAGKLDILEDLVNSIHRAKKSEKQQKFLKLLK